MGWLRLLPLLGLIAAGPALAGDLYRCVGADGVPNYTSKRMGGAVCKVVAHTAPASVAPKPAAPVAVPATVPAASGQGGARQSAAGAVASAGGAPRFLRMATSVTYSFVDANGVRNFSSHRPKGVAGVQVHRIEYPIFAIDNCYACTAGTGVDFGSVRLNTSAYASEIRDAARQYGVEEAVVRAVIHAESAFRANVRSNKGAQGLMQLIPATAARFGVADPYDPAQNISGGVQYLAWLMKRYRSDLSLVAAAYNAGEGAVDRNGGVPPYSETQLYVRRVGQLADRYRTALASP